MNWSAVQAVAELVAATGVIVSLAYLATQVRQNTRSIRAAATQDLLLGYNAILDFPKQSAYGARAYHAVIRGELSRLAPEEQSAARVGMIQIWRLYEHAYLQYHAGTLGDDVWEGWVYQIRMSAGLPGLRMTWPAIRPLVSRSFADWVDEMSEISARTAAEYADRWAAAGSMSLVETPDP